MKPEAFFHANFISQALGGPAHMARRPYTHSFMIIADSKWVDSTHAGNIRADKGFKAIQLIQ